MYKFNFTWKITWPNHFNVMTKFLNGQELIEVSLQNHQFRVIMSYLQVKISVKTSKVKSLPFLQYPINLPLNNKNVLNYFRCATRLTLTHVSRQCLHQIMSEAENRAAKGVCKYDDVKLRSVWSGIIAIFAWIPKLRGVSIERGLNSRPRIFKSKKRRLKSCFACSAYLHKSGPVWWFGWVSAAQPLLPDMS